MHYSNLTANDRYEPVHEKTNNLGFQQGPTQTRLYRHRRWSVALSKEGLYYPCSKNKGADQLRSYSEADLRLCFRPSIFWFSYAVAHMSSCLLVCLIELFLYIYRSTPRLPVPVLAPQRQNKAVYKCSFYCGFM